MLSTFLMGAGVGLGTPKYYSCKVSDSHHSIIVGRHCKGLHATQRLAFTGRCGSCCHALYHIQHVKSYRTRSVTSSGKCEALPPPPSSFCTAQF
jgi:hypothetical protein